MEFQNDLAQFRQTSRLRPLGTQQKNNYENLTSAFKKSSLTHAFVSALKYQDRQDTGYLPARQILTAVNDTFAQRKGGSNNMTEQQIQKLTITLNTNSRGEFSWKELLQHMYGEREGEAFYMMDQRALESEMQMSALARDSARGGTAGTFVTPTTVHNPQSGGMGNIGRKVITSRQNYEALVIKKLGPNATSPSLKQNDIENILYTLNI